MPDLERKIAGWRQRMAAGGIKTPAVLDELESHLREEMEQQVRAGANPVRAFEAAVRRIGRSDLLKAEFAKIGGRHELRPGRVVGIACGSFAVLFSLWVAPWLLTNPELSLPQRIMGFAAVALTLFSAASWRFSFKYLPVIRSRRARTMAALLCGLATLAWFCVFGNLLSSVIVPHIFQDEDVTGRIFVIGLSLLWAMALAAIFGAIAYGLEEAAHRRMGKDNYV
jgi:hypothetical protein